MGAQLRPELWRGAPPVTVDDAYVYWISGPFQSLFRVPKVGELDREIQPMISEIEQGGGIAVGGGYIYWTENDHIMRAACNGDDMVTLAEVPGSELGAIVLDETHVYFTNLAPGGRLMRVCR